MKEGSYTVDFLNGDGSVAFSLNVKSGAVAKGSDAVTLNGDGEISYKITASDAEGVKLIIDCKLR